MELIKLNQDKKYTSKDIAEWTGKEHKNVLRDIEDEANKLGEIGKLIFELSEYKDSSGKSNKMYNLTYDGIKI